MHAIGGGGGLWYALPRSDSMPGPAIGSVSEVLVVLVILLFWGAILACLVLLLLWLPRHWRGGPDALEIARRRYARGEISRAEYERLRDDLTHEMPARKST